MVSGRRLRMVFPALGLGYFILVFNSYQDSLKHVMIWTLSRRSQFLPYSFIRVLPAPPLIPYHCHHLHIVIHVSLIHVLAWCFSFRSIVCLSSCRPLLSALQRSTSYSYILLPSPTSGWFDAYYIIPTSFMLTSSLFTPTTRCACVCLCFILTPHLLGLIVILPSSLLRLQYTFYSSVLCPFSCVSYHTCACFHFRSRSPHC